MFDKLKQASALLGEAAKEAAVDSMDAVGGAYEGAKAAVKGAKVITESVKEIRLTRGQLEALYNQGNPTEEIILDDTATDDGYVKVRITIVEE